MTPIKLKYSLKHHVQLLPPPHMKLSNNVQLKLIRLDVLISGTNGFSSD